MKMKIVGDNYLHKLYVFDISFDIFKNQNNYKMYLWVDGLEISLIQRHFDIMDIYDYKAYKNFLFWKLSNFIKEIKEKTKKTSE